MDIKEQMDKALEAVDANKNIVQVYLSDLVQLQEDIAEIKRLLLAPGDTKFIELAVKTETVRNKLGLLTATKNVELRSDNHA